MFIDWLDQQLRLRAWNDRQLADHAKVSHTLISRLRGGLFPTWRTCAALAQAFDLPADMVFRYAGLLPMVDPACEEWAELQHLLPQLSPQDRRELVQIARIKLKRSP